MTDQTSSSNTQQAIPIWRSVVVLLLCVITTVVCTSRNEVNSSVTAGVIMKLPKVLGGYVGQSLEVTNAEKTILPLDTEFERSFYTSVDGQTGINCQIVLSGGAKRSIHRPEVCLPGQGWTIKSRKPNKVALHDGSSLGVMELLLERPVELTDSTQQSLFYYWYVGSDKTTPHHFERIFLTSKDRVLSNVNHRWAYIVVSSQVPLSSTYADSNLEGRSNTLHEFIADVVPYIHDDKVLQSL